MPAIFLTNIVKIYRIYRRPADIFKQVFALPGQKFYQEKRALDSISMHINAGEIYGIIGFNGSGKSTLMRIMSGVLQPTTGEVYTEGRLLAVHNLIAGLDAEMSGRQNIARKAFLYGADRALIEERIDNIADFSGLGTFLECPVQSYSSGMILRLCLSTILHLEYDGLLLDETLAVGDEVFRRKCVARLRTLREQGKIAVLISHGLQDLASLCDRIILLDGGLMRAAGPPEEIIQLYQRECDTAVEQMTMTPRARSEAMGNFGRTGEASIISLKCFDSNGQQVIAIASGQALDIQVSYKVHTAVPNLLLRFQIHRNDCLWVYGNNNYRQQVAIPGSPGEHCVRLRFKTWNLLASTYYFSIGLWPDEYTSLAARKPCDFIGFAAEILVTSSRSDGAGIALNNASWEVVS